MLLKGTELAEFIKERQSRAVNSLQHIKIKPHLVIIQSNQEVVSNKYIEIKQKYGAEIGIKVTVLNPEPADISKTIAKLNEDTAVHGIIVQLPVAGIDINPILNTLKPDKDVDGLGEKSLFDPATPTAILWLLSSYDIELAGKKVMMVGNGKLVGAPLAKILRSSGIEPVICDEYTPDLPVAVKEADVLITATGQPGLITPGMIKPGAMVVDAGTADVAGSLVGDVDPKVYKRNDIKISPVPGGVGPLTVCALFENLLTAFKRQVSP